MSVTEQTARPKVFVWPGDDVADVVDLSQITVGLSFAKGLNAPSGTGVVTVMPQLGEQSTIDLRRIDSLYRVLRPMLPISIGFDEPGGIALGLIDRVERVRTYQGQRVADGLRISFSDMGKLLQQDNVVRASLYTPKEATFARGIEAAFGPGHPLVNVFLGVRGANQRGGKPPFVGASIDDAIDWVLENVVSIRSPIIRSAVGGQGTAADLLERRFSVTTWNQERLYSDSLTQYQGDVFGFLRSVIDADFYEILVDTYPSGEPWPTVDLVVRPKPFDDPAAEFLPVREVTGLTWPDLRTRIGNLEHHEIREDEILSLAVGRDDAQAFGYYLVVGKHDLVANPDNLAKGLFFPAVDLFAVARHGLRAYQATVALVGGNLDELRSTPKLHADRVSSEVVEFRNRLVNWYRMNAYYETGGVTVPGRDRFRPGDPVYLPSHTLAVGGDTGARFYCHQVQWSWSYGSHYTCSLGLSRGQNPAMIEAFKADVAAAGAQGRILEA